MVLTRELKQGWSAIFYTDEFEDCPVEIDVVDKPDFNGNKYSVQWGYLVHLPELSTEITSAQALEFIEATARFTKSAPQLFKARAHLERTYLL